MTRQTSPLSSLGAEVDITELVEGLARKFWSADDFGLYGGVTVTEGTFKSADPNFVRMDADNERIRINTIVPPGATSLASATIFYNTTTDDDMIITVYGSGLAVGESGSIPGTLDNVAFAADTLGVSVNIVALDILGAFDAVGIITAGEMLQIEIIVTAWVAGRFNVFGVELVFA